MRTFNFNFAMIHGKVTKEPIFREFKEGGVCNFSLCIKNGIKSEDPNKIYEFFEIKAWSKLAEIVKNYVKKGYFKKGDFLEVIGRLKQDRWTDKNNQTKSAVNIVAEKINLLSYKKKSQKKQILEQM